MPRPFLLITALLCGCGTYDADWTVGRADDNTGRTMQRENGGALHVFIASSGSPGDGSESAPYVATTSAEFDSLLSSFADPNNARYLGRAPAVIHLGPGTFQTRGNAEWSPDNWILQDDWTLQGAGRDATTLEMDPYAPQYFPIRFPENGQYFSQQKLTPVLGRSVPGELARRQVLKDLTLNGNFSKLVHGGFFDGKPLKLGGVHLFGERSAIENVRFTDYGATYQAQETFVAILEAARNNSVPTATAFDEGCVGAECAHISDCSFEGKVDPVAQQSGMQITVFSIFGSYNGDYGNMTNPDRVDLLRRRPYLRRNRVIVDESNQSRPGGEGNLVQGFSILNGDGAVVSENVTIGARMGFYSDSLQQKNLTVTGNRFERAMIGVAFFVDQMPDFGDENVRITDNVITTIPWNDGARTGIYIRKSLPSIEAETWRFYEGPHRRFLKNFTIADNVIGFATPPFGAYANVGIEVHEVEGLTITGNRVDARFKRVIDTSAIQRKDASGVLIAELVNTGVTVSGNETFTGALPPLRNVVCAQAPEHQQLSLTCPGNRTIAAINFASYGTPALACGSSSTSSCHASASRAIVEQMCLGRQSCSVPAANDAFGDPCRGTFKRLAAEALCSDAPPMLRPNGVQCSERSDCASNYCYPGPEGLRYCIAGWANCVKPGTDGIFWNDTYSFGASSYVCTTGVGLERQ